MRIDLVTREYPPFIYGGAGVHVNELARVLRARVEVKVHCFDGPRSAGSEGAEPGVQGYADLSELADTNAALRTLGVDLAIAQQVAGADIVHSHTWYANMAGHWASLLHGIPHVISAHSLEPLRPWKAEQLGGGYRISSWAEKTAYEGAQAIVAVSNAMRDDILRCYPAIDPQRVRVIHNGIDLDAWVRPSSQTDLDHQLQVLSRYGLEASRPTVAFVGRITRQKGVPHLLRALRQVDPGAQVVLCAGAPDTPQIAAEVEGLVRELQAQRPGVVWISEKLERRDLIAVLSAATVFVTPSIYEPLGIVNLEAMALDLPVVATATGGIPDVVVDGQTGYLVPIEQMNDGTGTPLDPARFEADMAERINRVLADPQLAATMGRAGRARAEEHFTWEAIAEKTVGLYREILA